MSTADVTLDEVEAFAQEVLGVELVPYQREVLGEIMAGRPVHLPRRGGRSTMAKAINGARERKQVPSVVPVWDETHTWPAR